ncbi:hypothetical protein GAC16_06670, partial [Bacteroides thetaiotaomicron]
LSANSVMRGRLDARRTLKSLVADLRIYTNRNKTGEELKECIVIWEENKSILCEKKYENKNGRKQQYTF